MAARRWDRPDAHDHVLLLVSGNPALGRAIRDRLSRVAGRPAGGAGRHPRFKILAAPGPREAVRRAAPPVTAVALDPSERGGAGLDAIRALREARPELAILAYGVGSPTSDAIASVMAGADFFHDCSGAGCEGFERALELAIDRRRLGRLIERSQEEAEEARRRLAQLSGDLVRAVPGFRPISTREDVLPFREAARRYLLAAAQLYAGDARGLSKALGVSYFALRRLLARYEVPYPAARSRK